MPPAARLPGTAESIATSGQELRSGRISSVELTRTALDRIEAYSTALNAVVTVTAELALEAARRADRDLRAGRDRGPLHGIPVGLTEGPANPRMMSPEASFQNLPAVPPALETRPETPVGLPLGSVLVLRPATP